jgi:hypothetical protein
METIGSSETSVATQRTTRRHIPEDDTLHNHRCENLKSYTIVLQFVLMERKAKYRFWGAAMLLLIHVAQKGELNNNLYLP